jgi:tetratricopeptide (TPR) repeat protein
MKTQPLLVSLVISAFSVTTAQPFPAIATPNKLVQNDLCSLDINLAEAYYKRGNAKSDLGDNKSAIIDYNNAIYINPQFAEAYVGRGAAKYYLGDKQGAINDLNIAAKLFKSQNKQARYKATIRALKAISN